MHTGDQVPQVPAGTLLSESLLEMSRKGLGMTAVIDSQQRVRGIFTDGDLRRTLDRGIDIRTTPVDKVMTPNCKTVAPGLLAAEALQLMEASKINGLLVLDEEQRLIGALNMHDLLRARVM